MDWINLILIIYVLLLIPLANLCEKTKTKGLLILISGIFLTPIIGYIVYFILKERGFQSE